MAREKVLVTGAAGKVGRELVKILLKKDYAVRVLIHKNIPRDMDLNKIEIANGDLNNPDSLEHSLEGIDTVCHLAAAFDIFPPYRFEIDNDIVYRINAEGTYILMEAIRKNKKVKHIVFGSSESVYDSDARNRTRAITEKDGLFPARFYSLTKIIGEDLVKGYKYLYNIDFTILRFAWILDASDVLRIYEYETWEDILSEKDRKELSPKCSSGNALLLPVYENGKPRIDHIIDARDAASLCFLCIEHDNMARNEVFNAAGPKPFNYESMIKIISDKLGKNYFKGVIKNRVPYKISNSKAEKILRYRPEYAIENTILEALGEEGRKIN